MNIDDLKKLIQNTQWTSLGSGTYNNVLLSKTTLTIDNLTCRWVEKTPTVNSLLNRSERAVRKWNELNPEYPAYDIDGEKWIAPYLGGKQASDDQRADKVLEIYNRTGNIVADSAIKGNVLDYYGKIVCIDVDHAFRRGSIVSDNQNKDRQFKENYNTFLAECSADGFPKTVTTIRVLQYLEAHLSDDEINALKPISPILLNKLKWLHFSNTPLDETYIRALLALIENDPAEKIPHQYTELLIHRYGNQKVSIEEMQKCILDSLINSGMQRIIECGSLLDVITLVQSNQSWLTSPDSMGWTPLHYAAFYGQAEIANYLLENGVPTDLYTPPQTGNLFAIKSALELAILCSHTNVAIMLYEETEICLSRKIKYSVPTLMFASQANNLDLLQDILATEPTLLNATDAFQQTALIWASALGYDEMVAFLLNNNASLSFATDNEASPQHDYNCLDWAITKGHYTVANMLTNAGVQPNCEHKMINNKNIRSFIKNGNFHLLQLLITHNKDLLNKLDSQGYAPVHYAAYYGRQDMMRYLIEQGADVNQTARPKTNIKPISSKRTAMEIATEVLSQSDDKEEEAKDLYTSIILSLVTAKAKIPAIEPQKLHPIHLVAKRNKLNLMVSLLQQNPALIKARDHWGQTPLLYAITFGYTDMVEFLLYKNTEVNEPMVENANKRGSYLAPLDFAMMIGNKEVIRMLKDKGAKTAVENQSLLVQHSIFPQQSSQSSQGTQHVQIPQNFYY